jgi:predicted Ser/Thr protein kinase/tetratricopeptide (TPR) repeat protein
MPNDKSKPNKRGVAREPESDLPETLDFIPGHGKSEPDSAQSAGASAEPSSSSRGRQDTNFALNSDESTKIVSDRKRAITPSEKLRLNLLSKEQTGQEQPEGELSLDGGLTVGPNGPFGTQTVGPGSVLGSEPGNRGQGRNETSGILEFGDYRLEDEIARGGMGVVYRATQKSINRPVAVKMILSARLASEDEVRRFYAEAEAAAKLDHPNIVPIYEVGSHGDTHYFSMKLIEGKDLGRRLEELRGDTKLLVRVLEKVCRAVAHAHQRGVLHRDLKPANILLDENNEPFVTDFGLARNVGKESNITRTGAIVGTPSYMSPEQAAGESDLTTVSDVYSMGAILYEVLLGKPPFKGRTPMETLMMVINETPDWPNQSGNSDRSLELVAMKCLEKSPERRYPSARELADDLNRWLTGEPISIRAPSFSALTRNWMKQNFGNAPWVVVVGLLGGLLSGLGLWNATVQAERSSTVEWVYQQLPSQDPPFSVLSWTTPDWLVMPSLVIFILALALLGYFTALLAQTKSTSADLAAGLTVGVIAGAGAFFCALATMCISASVDNNDIQMLGLLADAPLDETPLKLTDAYPEFAYMDRNAQIALLKQKIITDRVWKIPHGLGLATIACFAIYVVAGVVETAVAGRALRSQTSRLSALGEYAFRAFPYVGLSTFIGVHVAVTLIFGRPGLALDWQTGITVVALLVAVIVEYRGLSWRIRLPSVIGGLIVLANFVVSDFGLLPSLARGRKSIAVALHKAERYPDNERVVAEAARSYQNVGVELYNGRRYSSALGFIQEGIQYIERLPKTEKDYRLDELTGVAYLNQAMTLWQLGDREKALSSISQASQMQPTNIPLHSNLVTFLKAAVGEESASELLESFIVDSPASWRVFKKMAVSKELPREVLPRSEFLKMQTRAESLIREKTQQLVGPLRRRLEGRAVSQCWTLIYPHNRDAIRDLQDRLLKSSADLDNLSALGRVVECLAIPPSEVDLTDYFPMAGDHTALFAIGKFVLTESQSVTVSLGSGDGFALWLDNEKLGEHRESRDYIYRENEFKTEISAGVHEIILRVDQNAGAWSFGLELDGRDGWPCVSEWLCSSGESIAASEADVRSASSGEN